MPEQETQGRISWEKKSEENFLKILEQIPAMIRGIAETRVSKKAESIVREDNRLEITEKDMVAAFFAETPGGFIPPMKASAEGEYKSSKNAKINWLGFNKINFPLKKSSRSICQNFQR